MCLPSCLQVAFLHSNALTFAPHSCIFIALEETRFCTRKHRNCMWMQAAHPENCSVHSENCTVNNGKLHPNAVFLHLESLTGGLAGGPKITGTWLSATKVGSFQVSLEGVLRKHENCPIRTTRYAMQMFTRPSRCQIVHACQQG